MQPHQVFNLYRVNVFATTDDHVAQAPTGNHQSVVVLQAAQIAGQQPRNQSAGLGLPVDAPVSKMQRSSWISCSMPSGLNAGTPT